MQPRLSSESHRSLLLIYSNCFLSFFDCFVVACEWLMQKLVWCDHDGLKMLAEAFEEVAACVLSVCGNLNHWELGVCPVQSVRWRWLLLYLFDFSCLQKLLEILPCKSAISVICEKKSHECVKQNGRGGWITSKSSVNCTSDWQHRAETTIFTRWNILSSSSGGYQIFSEVEPPSTQISVFLLIPTV